MSRHVNIVVAEAVDGDTEIGNGLAKKVFDILNGVSAYTIDTTLKGRQATVIICWDD